MGGSNVQQVAPVNPVHQKVDVSSNKSGLEDEVALLKKKLQISETERKLDQLALTGPQTEMEILQKKYEELQLKLKIKEMQDRLGSILILL